MAYTDVADTAEPAGDDAEQGKVSQEECNYRRGSPMKHCGVCTFYQGDETKSCSRVEGPISGFGLSDIFEMQQNPFGSRIGPAEAQMIDGMMQSPPDQSTAVQAPMPEQGRTQIGNRVYS